MDKGFAVMGPDGIDIQTVTSHENGAIINALLKAGYVSTCTDLECGCWKKHLAESLPGHMVIPVKVCIISKA